MKKIAVRYRITALHLLLLMISACAPEDELAPINEPGGEKRDYTIPDNVTWRGELPDLMEHEEISRETLVQCGLGHTDLKELPIIGGYPSNIAKEKAARGEVYLGGVATIESIKVDCMTCGYQYDARVRAWRKIVSNPAHLHEQPPQRIQQFPILVEDRNKRYVTWTQWIQQGEVVRNSVKYWSHASPHTITDKLNAVLSSSDFQLEMSESGDDDRTLQKNAWAKNGVQYKLNILQVHNQNKTHIDFTVITRETEITAADRWQQRRLELDRFIKEGQSQPVGQ